MQDQPIYLDYNATTPMDPRVLEAMMPWFLRPSNAGSRTHAYGKAAKNGVEQAREQVAAVIGAQPEEIFFTSGATESNNIAILGLVDFAAASSRRHIVSTAIEHKAVLEPLEYLQRQGFEIDLVAPTSGGFVEAQSIIEKVRDDTLLVSVMHANNETGVIQPLSEICELLRETNVLFHTDAAQTFGKEVEELRALDADLISFTAHKIYGPKGIGGLFVRRSGTTKRPVAPIAVGGGQERGLRAGTIPVESAIGFGAAAELATSEYQQRRQAADALRQQLMAGLEQIDHRINGDQTKCQSHVLNVTFPGVDSEALMMGLRESVAVSNGSACTSSSYKPSHVLVAMGLDGDAIESTLRISWGQATESIPLDAIVKLVKELTVTL